MSARARLLRTLPVVLAVLVAVAFFVLVATLESPPPPVSCSLVVAPDGSDAAVGTAAAPLRSVARLVAALRPGQTGCIRAGVYYEDVEVTGAGRAGAPIAIRSFPGERATLDGRLWLARGADHVVVSDLDLNGRPAAGANAHELPSPTVNADDDTFARDDITNDRTGICFVLGSGTFGRAAGTVIVDSRIHDCGQLPPTNGQHGIYVADADRTLIARNWIYANADRGVQLYPDAQHTAIEHNVIDGNGEGVTFSGAAGRASDDNVVAQNLITNSNARADVESFYPPGTPAGSRNVVVANCLWGGRPPVDRSGGGFSLAGNRLVDPRYRDAAAHDYRLRAASPCRAIAPPPPP